VSIAVVDTGVGIPADRLPYLFRDFVQVGNEERDASRGVGLGLSLSRRLANAIGGTITVRSAEGVGSTFVLALPPPPPPGG
jgi:signal transduction histidine kinase